MMDVSEAQIPESGPDHGTSEYNWTTDQIGGEIDYRGGSAITHGSNIVGLLCPTACWFASALSPVQNAVARSMATTGPKRCGCSLPMPAGFTTSPTSL